MFKKLEVSRFDFKRLAKRGKGKSGLLLVPFAKAMFPRAKK